MITKFSTYVCDRMYCIIEYFRKDDKIYKVCITYCIDACKINLLSERLYLVSPMLLERKLQKYSEPLSYELFPGEDLCVV
jgi:hypothetical protein